MTKKDYHVVYVSDRAYRPYVDVSAASVRHSATGRVAVHVIDVDEPKIAERIASFPNYHGSRATFAKLLIPEVLPDVDWALYLDGDTLALGDVCEVFEWRDESKLIVGSRDPENFNLGPDDETPWLKSRGLSFAVKICAGVMLMNLKAMREEKVLAQCLAFFARYGIPPLNEQTALNCVCAGRIGLLPPQWGVFSMCPENVDFAKSAIIHYPQDLPWRRGKLNKLMHDFVWLWWKFAEARRAKLDVGCADGVGFLWRRWAFLAIQLCPWLVTWSPYLRARLRPLHGLTREERQTVLARWAGSAARPEEGWPMNVAILMTCHNRRETTLRCLESLAGAVREIREKGAAGRDKLRWELFVVDDGSTDGTGEAIREYAEKVKGLGDGERWCEIHLIQGDGDLYWAKGMALAWDEALRYEERVSSSTLPFAFDYFLWLNDDTILRPDALLKLLRSSAQNRDAVVAGSLIDEITGSKTCGVVTGGLFTGNFVSIPRSAYEKVGLICGRFHHAWADSDYAMRCRKEGVEIVELERVGTTRGHDLRPSLKGVSIIGRIRLLFDPKGWCVHDLWLYRRRNWGICVAIASSLHLILHVLKGER